MEGRDFDDRFEEEPELLCETNNETLKQVILGLDSDEVQAPKTPLVIFMS